ncbi:MAG: DNA primase [Bacillota bacterium]|nr:DNA primase [Bacillota bacterium]
MALPDSFLELLRSRCDIEDVISQYVTVKRRGRSLVGLCPFHSEKTPSFTVFPETQSYYCFGCGAGGDVITFIRNIENLDYLDAVRFLADKAGIEMPEENREDEGYKKLREQILNINRSAANFFYKQLLSKNGVSALKYLRNRGLSDKTIKKFGLGYSSDNWTSLTDYLSGEGFDKELMKRAGLCAKNQKGGYYDYFRNRVMFPIVDVRGSVIGFGGRVMDDSQPKYLNSPDTPVFKKSLNLFSLNNAKGSGDTLILAEGYMDVISIYQAGFRNTVATLGTALTAEQARLISRYAKEVVISYDSDGAGRKASQRAITIFADTGIKVRVLSMSGAKDPDEFIKKFGADKFQMLINKSENHVEYRLSQLRAGFNLELPDDKVSYLKAAAEILADIQSSVERDVYAGKIAEELDVSRESILHEVKSIIKAKWGKKQKDGLRKEEQRIHAYRDSVNPDKAANLKEAKAEEGIICTIFFNPDYVDNICKRLGDTPFVTPFNKKLFDTLCELVNNGIQPDTIVLSQYFTPPEMGRISGIIAQRDLVCGETLIEDYIDILKEHYRKRLTTELESIDNDDLKDYMRQLGKIKGKGSNRE